MPIKTEPNSGKHTEKESVYFTSCITGIARRAIKMGITNGAAIVLLGLSLNSYAKSNETSTSEKINSTQTQIKQVSNDISKMNKLLTTLAKQRSRSTRDLEQFDRDISKLHVELGTEESSLKETEEKLEQLINEGQALDARKQAATEGLKQQIRSRYQSPTGTSQIKLLFKEENPREIDRQLNYHRYILQSQDSKITEFNQLISEIELNQQQVLSTKEQLILRKASLEKQIDSLNQKLTERKGVLKNISHQEKQNSQKLQDLKENQKELAAVLELLKLQAAREALAQHKFKANKGKLIWPVKIDKAAASQLRKEKKGIIIPAKPLSPVKAIFYGKVVFADWLRGYGWLTIIQHQDEYLSLYAHNASLEKKVGDVVKTGDIIAHTGNSGQTSESSFFTASSDSERGSGMAQLYFELRKEGRAIDPTPWMTKN